jgi:hypothetical protein
MTLVAILTMLVYFVYLFNDMLSGESDIINTTTFTNNFQDGMNEVNMTDHVFMPYLSIEQSDYDISLSEFDIFENGTNRWNVSKVANYIEFVTDIQFKNASAEEEQKDIIIPFRNCRVEDFRKRKYFGGLKFEDNVPSFLCPDTDREFSDFLQIKNGYSNATFRQSFSIKAFQCNTDLNKNCKNQNITAKFLKTFYFTMYILTERVEFNQTNLNQDLLKT